MPSYAKFLKEVLSNKRKLPDTGVETLRGECSAILECKVPKKEADPRSFTIPVKFCEVLVNKALVDLGASVSIMPLSLYKRINAEIKPTRMSLQLPDRSVRFPIGIVEDFPVQIRKFYVPCDFVIMDIIKDHIIHIILGRDFLKTTRAVFDVFNGKLTLNILGENIEFYLPSMMKGPADESICRAEVARVEIMHPQYDDPLRSILEEVEDGRCSEAASLRKLLDEPDFDMELVMETILEASLTIKQERSTPPQVDLKPFPSILKYAYLGENETYPVIVNAELNNTQLD